MKLSDKKYLDKLVSNKYAEKHRKNNKVVSVYIPNGVKDELDKFCKRKELKLSQWIKSLIIKELENNAQRRYNYNRKKFVEVEEKAKKLAVVLSVVLIITSVPPKTVEASWFSDFCGAVFTVITAPIWVICPDNPTFRKNNPFRKKAWEENPDVLPQNKYQEEKKPERLPIYVPKREEIKPPSADVQRDDDAVFTESPRSSTGGHRKDQPPNEEETEEKPNEGNILSWGSAECIIPFKDEESYEKYVNSQATGTDQSEEEPPRTDEPSSSSSEESSSPTPEPVAPAKRESKSNSDTIIDEPSEEDYAAVYETSIKVNKRNVNSIKEENAEASFEDIRNRIYSAFVGTPRIYLKKILLFWIDAISPAPMKQETRQALNELRMLVKLIPSLKKKDYTGRFYVAHLVLKMGNLMDIVYSAMRIFVENLKNDSLSPVSRSLVEVVPTPEPVAPAKRESKSNSDTIIDMPSEEEYASYADEVYSFYMESMSAYAENLRHGIDPLATSIMKVAPTPEPTAEPTAVPAPEPTVAATPLADKLLAWRLWRYSKYAGIGVLVVITAGLAGVLIRKMPRLFPRPSLGSATHRTFSRVTLAQSFVSDMIFETVMHGKAAYVGFFGTIAGYISAIYTSLESFPDLANNIYELAKSLQASLFTISETGITRAEHDRLIGVFDEIYTNMKNICQEAEGLMENPTTVSAINTALKCVSEEIKRFLVDSVSRYGKS
jgi:hypothetical protein